MRQSTLWSSQEHDDRFCLGFPTDFGLPRKVHQRHTHPDSSMIMNHSRSDRSLHVPENAEAFYPRPTLPSLRSQVGEYLPASSQSDLQQPPYYHDARLRSGNGSRRLSISSTSLGSSSAPRSAMVRTPSTDGRHYVSSSSLNAHPTFSHSSHKSPVAESTVGARQPSFSGSTHAPPVTATRSTVTVACTNCRSAHLACSDGRPCRRCLQTGRAATCIDVEPKKRGRPRASDIAAVSMTTSMMRDLSTGPSNVSNAELEDLIIIMSTSLRCARLTSAVVQTLGLPLKTILEQPFSTFIHPDEKQEYARFSIGLLAYPGVTSRPVPVSASRLHQVAMSELTGRLSGAAIHAHIFRLRSANNRWIPFKFEAYLGAGFGAHPKDKESLRFTYVVLKLFPVGSAAAPRVDLHSPSSSNSSSYSMAEPRREGPGSMCYYGYESGGSYRSTCGMRESHDHQAHRQSFSNLYGHSYDTSRPPSRSGFD